MKKPIALCIVGLCTVMSLFAQFIPSSPTDPVIDGIFSPGEYASEIPLRDMRLGYALSNNQQEIYFVLEAPTNGWVSIGLGSNRMNGAHMIMGYDDLTNKVIVEETGRGRSHSPASTPILLRSAIAQTGAKTTLEFSVPASLYASGRELSLIVAYGNQNNIRSRHARHSNHTIRFAR